MKIHNFIELMKIEYDRKCRDNEHESKTENKISSEAIKNNYSSYEECNHDSILLTNSSVHTNKLIEEDITSHMYQTNSDHKFNSESEEIQELKLPSQQDTYVSIKSELLDNFYEETFCEKAAFKIDEANNENENIKYEDSQKEDSSINETTNQNNEYDKSTITENFFCDCCTNHQCIKQENTELKQEITELKAKFEISSDKTKTLSDQLDNEKKKNEEVAIQNIEMQRTIKELLNQIENLKSQKLRVDNDASQKIDSNSSKNTVDLILEKSFGSNIAFSYDSEHNGLEKQKTCNNVFCNINIATPEENKEKCKIELEHELISENIIDEQSSENSELFNKYAKFTTPDKNINKPIQNKSLLQEDEELELFLQMENEVLNEEMKNIGFPQDNNLLIYKGMDNNKEKNLQNLVLNQMLNTNTTPKAKISSKAIDDSKKCKGESFDFTNFQQKERSFSDLKGFNLSDSKSKNILFDMSESSKSTRKSDTHEKRDSNIKLQ